MAGPEESLARALSHAFRPGFSGGPAAALHLATLALDAVDAALPLTRHEPAEPALASLEELAPGADVYSWDGAPGWDVVLEEGLRDRGPIDPGPSVLDGLGLHAERDQQRGELKRRARAEAARLVAIGRDAAKVAGGDRAAQTAVALHASLCRLFGIAAVHSALLLPEDRTAGPLPPPGEAELVAEMDARGDLSFAQDEWRARISSRNPAAAREEAFSTFFAGLSQALRLAHALRAFRDAARGGAPPSNAEALLGTLGGWQPVRWASLRHGAPSDWVVALCPPQPGAEPPLARLARECSAGLDLIGRLWTAEGASITAFTALAAVLVARCASAVALFEEIGGGPLAQLSGSR